MSVTGTVVSIHIAATGAAPVKTVREIRALVGQGLEGDRYALKLGTYSNDPGSGRDVTLIEVEAIEALRRDYQITLELGMSRRNIVTRSVALNHLVDVEFSVGDAVLRGTRLCDPCAHMEKLTVKGALRGLIHRGGLRAEIIRGGIIRVGDPIVPLDVRRSAVPSDQS
jgi:MOSC domain-containing protein YiiM